ncbi:MAG TPA: DoxX family membrane protein [Candidatus Limnocylindrales bacterium]|jgi:thiosulfate dehydrogenase [quinone] large subunit|nr:DoxX family membrane protein [Candidatus Limnocylindrales bacterium]
MSALRRSVVWLGVAAAAIVLYLTAPWETFGLKAIEPSSDVFTLLSIVFWVLAVVIFVVLFADRNNPGATVVEVEGPAFSRFLFSNSRAGLLWLPVRMFVGFSFLEAGLHKLFPAGKAMGAGWLDGGASLLGYWNNAVAIPEPPGRAAITFEWYRDFLTFLINNNAQHWFAYLIVGGEIAIGLGLIFGVLTGFAAFFGCFMNMSFLLAGSASTNPVLFTLGIGLILAWRVAGYYGVDRWLLPRLGVPWHARVATAPPLAPAPMTS